MRISNQAMYNQSDIDPFLATGRLLTEWKSKTEVTITAVSNTTSCLSYLISSGLKLSYPSLPI